MAVVRNPYKAALRYIGEDGKTTVQTFSGVNPALTAAQAITILNGINSIRKVTAPAEGAKLTITDELSDIKLP